MAVDDCITFIGAGGGLINALRIKGHRFFGAGEPLVKGGEIFNFKIGFRGNKCQCCDLCTINCVSEALGMIGDVISVGILIVGQIMQ